MDIQFYGATERVTGSKHLLKLDDGTKILLDCGLFQEDREDTDELNLHFGFSPSEIDAVILSHAHIDHSGLLPKLVKEGYDGLIYCTPATRDLCEVMLQDSAKIQTIETKKRNQQRAKSNQKPLQPLYEKKDVEPCLKLFQSVSLGESFSPAPHVTARFREAGHLLGSTSIHMTIENNSKNHDLLFTGDLGRPNDILLNEPSPPPQVDTIICESTYGDRLHQNLDSEQILRETIDYTCSYKGGLLLIPAFSVGRTQELLYLMQKLDTKGHLPDVPIYVDSPLANKATKIYHKHHSLFNPSIRQFIEKEGHPFQFRKTHFIENRDESMALNQRQSPAIIIAGAGMMVGGRILHHMIHHITEPKTTLFIVGFCAPGTLGHEVMQQPETVELFGQTYPIEADIYTIDTFSSHADYHEILDYLSHQDPENVRQLFLVHGDKPSLSFFRSQLLNVGFSNIFVPKRGKPFPLE